MGDYGVDHEGLEPLQHPCHLGEVHAAGGSDLAACRGMFPAATYPTTGASSRQNRLLPISLKAAA